MVVPPRIPGSANHTAPRRRAGGLACPVRLPEPRTRVEAPSLPPAVAHYDLVMQPQEKRDASRPGRLAGHSGELPRIGGLLLVYRLLLIIFAVHNSMLTAGSIVVYAHSSATGRSHVPLGSLVFYVITNVALILYVIYLFRLMSRRRKSAIINNIVFNILSAVFLVSWHVIGEKSTTGTIIDSVSNLVIVAYFLLSGRVRRSFVIDRTASYSR
jgi:hypothetical protein